MSRIIAGTHGGRRLVMPPGRSTRPTTDRVREALFSAIESWAGPTAGGTADGSADAPLAGLAVLDLYAGSGAVGLEAASRGADPVLLVESSPKTVTSSTRRNVADLGVRAEIRTVRVEAFAAQPAARSFDVAFADPPYELATADLEAVLGDLIRQGWIADNALLVVERSRRSPALTWPVGFETWIRRYGETVLEFGAR